MIKYLMPVVLIATALCGCSKKSNTPGSGVANVMFVNAMANGPFQLHIDGRVNGSKQKEATDLSLYSSSGYTVVSSGTSLKFSFADTSGRELKSISGRLEYNMHYTAFAFGSVTQPQIALVPDPMFTLLNGSANVRFFNFCARNPHLYCYFGTTLLDSLEYYYKYPDIPPTSTSRIIAAGTKRLLLKDPRNPLFSAYIDNQTFDADHNYTVIFTDTSVTTGTGFKLMVIRNY
ncbi:MAG: hypothetical protein K0Q79_2470 [Flavipsychrobacter sp.]|jgi:hypothetical protein|nr:hypothetical protein [Flavipsychrobacter sp.]